MARVIGTVKFPRMGDYPKSMEGTYQYFEDSDKELKKLDDVARDVPEGEVVGKVIHFPVADGAALYLVVKEKPLQLKHIPYIDAWQADPILIRGLRKADILQRWG